MKLSELKKIIYEEIQKLNEAPSFGDILKVPIKLSNAERNLADKTLGSSFNLNDSNVINTLNKLLTKRKFKYQGKVGRTYGSHTWYYKGRYYRIAGSTPDYYSDTDWFIELEDWAGNPNNQY